MAFNKILILGMSCIISPFTYVMSSDRAEASQDETLELRELLARISLQQPKGPYRPNDYPAVATTHIRMRERRAVFTVTGKPQRSQLKEN